MVYLSNSRAYQCKYTLNQGSRIKIGRGVHYIILIRLCSGPSQYKKGAARKSAFVECSDLKINQIAGLRMKNR